MTSYAGLAAVAIAVLGTPYVVSDFWLFMGVEVFVFALYALSLNLLLGYGGMLSFGHPAFFGIGAYAIALLVKKAGVSLPLAFALAPVAAAVAAGLIGYFCVRRTGIYFAMLTFAFQMLAYTVALKSRALTGGDDGITGLRAPGVLGQPRGYYYFAALLVGVAIFFIYRIVNSPFGYAARAMRANPTRTDYLGINVLLHRWLVFILGGFFAGVAGALFALSTGSVFPGWLNWTASAAPIVMTVLGGMHTFAGPIVGALVYVSLETIITGYTEYWPMIIGGIILVLVIALPNGLTSLKLFHGRE